MKHPDKQKVPSGAPHAGMPALPVMHMPIRTPDIAEIRRGIGLTQAQFAVMFGFSVSAVRAWERGAREPELAARYYLYVIEQQAETVIATLRGKTFPNPKRS